MAASSGSLCVQLSDEHVLRNGLARISAALAVEHLVLLELLQHTPQLLDGRRMHVDTHVDLGIVETVDDLDGSRALGLAIAGGALPTGIASRLERAHEAIL